MLAVAPCQATDFRFGDVEGLFDLALAYGVGVRMQDADEDLIGIANGGRAPSVNNDDGDLNYATGVFSSALRLDADLTLAWKQFGAYVRGFAFHDFENEDAHRDRTPLTSQAKAIVGQDAGLLDHYVSAKLSPWGIPMLFRLGDQVVNWGETTFVRDGIDIINPFDFTVVAQPAMSARDALIPQGMIWGAANVTERLALEAYYQYEWEPVRLPPVGTYFSTNDLFGGNEVNFVTLGAGRFSDQGTDLDVTFGLPAGTLGFDPDFYKIPGRGIDTPADGGQFGFTVSTILPDSNATKFGVHLVRYHTRLPVFSGLTADQAAVDATSQQNVDELAASLAPDYVSTGLSPEEAAEAATQTAAALTTSEYANQAGYLAEYPENVTMIGASFSTSTLRRGLLISGDISHHFNFPFQVDLDQVFTAVLSPIQFDPVFGDGLLGRYGADEVVRGYRRRDKTQATLGVTQLLGPHFGASQTSLGGDLGWVHVYDMPGASEAPLQAVAPPTADSWGYRVIGTMTYHGVLGAFTLVPRILWTSDVNGVTPAPVSTFVEGRKSLSIGVGARYIDRWTADLGYTRFFGGGDDNLVRDRDFLRFRISYYF